jgi:DNA replication ATP-dependent helicase Dna2
MHAIAREHHAALLRREYNAQKLSFTSTLQTSATTLRENGTLLVGKYVGFDQARGNVLFWFPATRALPRRGEPLFAFVTRAELTNPAKWGNAPYQELRGSSLHGAELMPRFWQAKPEVQGYHVGFSGAGADFIQPLEQGKIVCFGPQEPPLEYLANLGKLVSGEGPGYWPAVAALLDLPLGTPGWAPEDLPTDANQALRVQSELAARDAAIIQGPPGTGKSYLTAKLYGDFLAQGKRVLVTALTNRALLELLTKPGLATALAEGSVYKAGMSEDEKRAAPGLREGQDYIPQAGTLLLLTYYRMSKRALEAMEPPFDTVVIEEASQAYLATIAAAQALGEQLLLVGDPQQLPPIMEIEVVTPDPQRLDAARDGLRTVCDHWQKAAGLLLTDSFRLPPRAVACTNEFYDGRLHSQAVAPGALNLPIPLGAFFNSQGGPSIHQLVLPLGQKDPVAVIELVTQLVIELLRGDPQLEIAVLSTYRKTVSALQRAVLSAVGAQDNVLVDTVARVQGLTTDVVIYVVVNDGRANQVQPPHFNVATSRARKHTLLLVPNGFENEWYLHPAVAAYLRTATGT